VKDASSSCICHSDPPEAAELRRLEDTIKSMERQMRGVGYVRKRKLRPLRVEKRPRLTWPCWLQDWYKALHSTGWICCNKVIKPRNAHLGKAWIKKMRALYMYRHGIVVCLHPNLAELPKCFYLLEEIDVGSKPKIAQVFHIVRGNRQTRGFEFQAPFGYVVEINGALCDVYSSWGGWESTDGEIKALYSEYLAASPHHRAQKNMRKTGRHSKDVGKTLKEFRNSLLAFSELK